MCLPFPETRPSVHLLRKHEATLYLPFWNFIQNNITFPFLSFLSHLDPGLCTAFPVFCVFSSFLWVTSPSSCLLSSTTGHFSHVQKAWLIYISFLQTESDSYRLSTPGFCSQALIKLSSCFLHSLLPNSVINKTMNTEKGTPPNNMVTCGNNMGAP